MNDLLIKFEVHHRAICRIDHQKINACNKQHIYAHFCFDASWRCEAGKVAVFSKKGEDSIEVPLVNHACLIPMVFTKKPGIINVFVYSDHLTTINSAKINILSRNPPPPVDSETVVRSLDRTIKYLRQNKDYFEYYADGMWRRLESNVDTLPEELISSDDDNNLVLGSDCKLFVSKITETGIKEAPIDGKLYGRKNGVWEEIITTGPQSDWQQTDEKHPEYVRNKPMINDVVLTGNRVLPEIALTNLEIEDLFSNQV